MTVPRAAVAGSAQDSGRCSWQDSRVQVRYHEAGGPATFAAATMSTYLVHGLDGVASVALSCAAVALSSQHSALCMSAGTLFA